MDSEVWEGADFPARRSPLIYPPCECGEVGCPDRLDRPGQNQARETERDSPVIQTLRARIREENYCRRKFRRPE